MDVSEEYFLQVWVSLLDIQQEIKLKTAPNFSSSLSLHKNDPWDHHRCFLNCLIAWWKLFLLISNCCPLPVMVRGRFWGNKCFRWKGHFRHRKQCLGAGYQPCHQKWGSNYALKPNIVSPKFRHHTLFVLPTKVTLKLVSLHYLLPLHHW